ncbi:MAG: glycosyltransferase [Verrucomicrobiia bacterium]
MTPDHASSKSHPDGEGCLLAIPAHRDLVRLKPFLVSLCETLEVSALRSVRVLVVDDGSPAGEQGALARFVEDLRPRYPFLLPAHVLFRNLGKGGAVRAGWDLGDGSRWLGFVDADGAVPAREVVRLMRLAERGDGGCCYFATRIRMLGYRVRRRTSRHLVGRAFATLSSLLLGIHVYDSQCGLKIIPATAYARIRPLLVSSGYAMDVELVVALDATEIPMVEVPIDWEDVPGGKVSLLRDPWKMFLDLLAIRRRRRRWT